MSKEEAMQVRRRRRGRAKNRCIWLQPAAAGVTTDKKTCLPASICPPASPLSTPQKYIDLVAEGDPAWESHEALKDYKEEQ